MRLHLYSDGLFLHSPMNNPSLVPPSSDACKHTRARTLTGPGVGLYILSDSGTHKRQDPLLRSFICACSIGVIEFLALFDLSTLNLLPYRPCPNCFEHKDDAHNLYCS